MLPLCFWIIYYALYSWFTVVNKETILDQDNQHKIYILPLLDQEERDNYFYWIGKHLEYYCKGLGFEITFANDYTGPATMIITASGVKELYPKVYELIDNAPKIDDWKFEALKRPSKEVDSDLESPYEFGPFKIKIADLSFQPVKYIKSTGKIIIHIYSNASLRRARQRPGSPTKLGRSNPINNKDLKTAMTYILEDLLGEELLYAKIKNFKFYRNNRNRGITYKLIHLKNYSDMINKN